MIRSIVGVMAATLSANVAFAHVTLENGQAKAGSTYKAVFRVPHGCDGSATTAVRVKIPSGVIGVKPMPKAGWTIELITGKYAKPYAYFGDEKLSEGVQEVAWKGGNLPDSYYDEFVFRAYLSKDIPAGQTVHFPVVQECEKGVDRWIEIPVEGQPEPPHPAPGVKLSALTEPASQPGMFKAGAITIDSPWLRATPGGAKVAGGYMKISNTGAVADRLVGGSIDGALRFEVHEMNISGDVMKMRPLPGGLEIKPGDTIELKPGGFHIMGLDLQGPIAEGPARKGTLRFEKAGTVAIEYRVAPIGSTGEAHKH